MDKSHIKTLIEKTKKIVLVIKEHYDYNIEDYADDLKYCLYDLLDLLNYLDKNLSNEDITISELEHKIKQMELNYSLNKSAYYIEQEEKWLKITLEQQKEIEKLRRTK